MLKNFLLTGKPGIGKTTVITKIAEMAGKNACGFYTAEIRENGYRKGFEIITLSGEKNTLAHVDFKSKHKVGKYGVKPENLETPMKEVFQAIKYNNAEILLVDEIGKMELFAGRFKDMVLGALDSPIPVVGTIMAKSHPFCDLLKDRSDVEIIEVTPENRNNLPEKLVNYTGNL